MISCNGVVLLNKPKGPTSHDMIYEMRRIFKTKKIGHTGTLDPMATGVLPICIGNATKASDMLVSENKEYIAEITFGISTDTGDITGNVIESVEALLDADRIRYVIENFTGEMMQVPPMYSARKINGKKLYELARDGQTVERKAEKIKIYETEYLGSGKAYNSYVFRVLCSKGTYIRTVCEDIGKQLNCPACMSELSRTRTGQFSIDKSYSLDEIRDFVNKDLIDELIIPTYELFDYPIITLSDKQSERMKNGVFVSHPDIEDGCLYRVFDSNNEFFSVGICVDGRLRIKKSFRI